MRKQWDGVMVLTRMYSSSPAGIYRVSYSVECASVLTDVEVSNTCIAASLEELTCKNRNEVRLRESLELKSLSHA